MNENEDVKEKYRQSAVPLNFASLSKLITRDLKLQRDYYPWIRKYTKNDLKTFLEYPQRSERPIRDISVSIYTKSNHYRRLINHFAKMPLFAYTLEPINIDYTKVDQKSLVKQHQKVSQFLETMNIKHEFSKILTVAFRDDVFFGYEHYQGNSYFIQKLNPDYCEISSTEDGCYNIAFDFTYFQTFPERLDKFPPEFKQKYGIYMRDANQRWQELDSSKTICIKVNEELEYLMPPFFAVLEAIFDIEFYKEMKKDSQHISNYKVLIQKLPMRTDSDQNNDFLIGYDEMVEFHNKAAQALPDQVGLITTPMEVKDISFEKDIADVDTVERAERDYWNIAGVSQLLFNTDKTSSISLNRSIQADEVIVFGVLRQIERWINRRLKFFINNVNFKVNMLNVTEFNKTDVLNDLISSATVGMPVKSMIAAVNGLTPSAFMNMLAFENDVLKLHEKLIPLASSHTQSDQSGGSNGSGNTATKAGGKSNGASGGRPKASDNKVGSEALKARDSGKGKNK